MYSKKVFLIAVICLFAIPTKVFSQENNQREFRGVWVATVENIDWPSAKNIGSENQKKEIIKILDRFKSLNFNAVIFQIRPSADAFYNSKFEPWSAYLNGESNKKPTPYYDPLAFIIEETHKRGMEFHAWLNPYRAVVNYQEYHAKPFPLTYEKPEWFINYGKNKYFNPGIPEVRKYTNKIVADIVQNYDIDAIHFDDYFYPYKIEGQNFPDEDAFKKYGASYYPNQLEDWRRNNVNIIVQELKNTIKTIKPWVQFGVSPFGVWRNKAIDSTGSDTDAGQTNYDDLYADILLWLKNGWLDYVVPQAYWHIGFKKADYAKIVTWWAENNYDINLYIGQAMYRLGSDKAKAWKRKNKTEIEKQLDLNQSISNIQGSVYFSAKSFAKNTFSINKILVEKYYKSPILPPTIQKNKFIPEPVFNLGFSKGKHKYVQLHWMVISENKEKEAVKFLIYRFTKEQKVDLSNIANIIALTGENHLEIPKKLIKKGDKFIVQAVSRNNNVSNPTSVIK